MDEPCGSENPFRRELSQVNIYKISRSTTETVSYDEWDSAIVAAHSEDDAREIIPSHGESDRTWDDSKDPWWGWAESKDNVEVTLIGLAHPSIPRGVVLASFNAG